MPMLVRWARWASSPRTRRYFHGPHGRRAHLRLFSAHAEVFPSTSPVGSAPAALLRARGGISVYDAGTPGECASSPRTRRYFRCQVASQFCECLFSAHAEVFPIGTVVMDSEGPLLRARGGISLCGRVLELCRISSPRTRRYFPTNQQQQKAPTLFSAHAEVFPSSSRKNTTTMSLLRARGGISNRWMTYSPGSASSPRTRRYFRAVEVEVGGEDLFSAHAEVFPVIRC